MLVRFIERQKRKRNEPRLRERLAQGARCFHRLPADGTPEAAAECSNGGELDARLLCPAVDRREIAPGGCVFHRNLWFKAWGAAQLMGVNVALVRSWEREYDYERGYDVES